MNRLVVDIRKSYSPKLLRDLKCHAINVIRADDSKVGGVLEAVLACTSSMYFKLLLIFIESLYVHLFGIKNMGLLQRIAKKVKKA